MKKLLILALVAGFAFSANIAKCTGCHGANFEKKALGKSAVLNTLTKEQIVADMKGYRSGTLNKYGLGGIMKGQAAGLSDQDIEMMANQIVK